MLTARAPVAEPATSDRDLVADVVRAGALFVVVLWHTTFSMDHRTESGRLAMPNPIHLVPGPGWLLTWLLQVMPIFVVVSGAVNGASWARATERRQSPPGWCLARLARLGTGAAVVGGVVVALELGAVVLGGGSFVPHNVAVLVPLWTLAVLAAVTPLTAIIERSWRRRGALTLLAPGGVVLAGDLVRFHVSAPLGGALSTGAVWAFAYCLGWVYRHRSGRTAFPWLVGGFGAMAALVAVGPYPASMVATQGSSMSNMLPTTAPVAALAAAQLGLLLTCGPALGRWLSIGRRPALVAGISSVGMAVYLLHMFALVAVLWIAGAVGFTISGEASATWWALRPVWLLAVAVALIPMVKVAKRILR